ncbi:MAG: hypothetical protein KKA42_05605 [candidate division Zixibacteria bacterium]|nr:hypothetical protein [candidate division Zixibacteria bacterium]
MTRWLCILLTVACFAGTVTADDTSVVDTTVVDTAQAATQIDTVLFVPPQDKSRAGDVTNPVNLEEHLYQQPTVALFKSLAVPGWGQLGNRKYVKAFVIAGLESWAIVSAFHFRGQANDARNLYESALTVPERNLWYNVYENKRQTRNKFYWYFGILAFLSMFDAYVDAHLSGSPLDKRNEQFEFEVAPEESGGVRATVSFSF